MKQYIHILVIAFLAHSSLFAAMQAVENDENINYKWSFVAKVGPANDRKVAMVTRDTMLRTGDEFKMMVNVQKKCYVYVIHKSSANELSVLYPTSFEAQFELEKNYYLPKGRSWFKLDSSLGTETFYILASHERLTELEQQVNAYLVANREQQKALVASVVGEIKDIKKRYRTYSTLAERPISIAGNVRGTKKDELNLEKFDVGKLATEISANNFYSKTISIEHK
ncbi:MAG: DUF4384 domain-containing protein [Bacteriovoracaceae bacterium]|nr:DUF4384 domain-containing protein [Bacteroidota bacterium]